MDDDILKRILPEIYCCEILLAHDTVSKLTEKTLRAI